ncbi:NACHT domain-containing protein [Geobacter anodireducens]
MLTDGNEFEAEVRRVARLMWPADVGSGAVMFDGKERDGVFISEECVHAIECTVSRTKSKAEDDGKKLVKILKELRKKFADKAAKGWFITQQEPTADQRTAIQQLGNDLVAVSYDVFRSKLVDAKSYLNSREAFAFGSVRDPETGAIDDRASYVQMDLCGPHGDLYNIRHLSEGLLKGDKFVVLGDYGAGKSTTLREIFFDLRTSYFKHKTVFFPVLLNLRDHHGQTNPAEALERHGRNIGYPHPHHLVRAWRAGFITLLLDGFDELGSPGWTGIPKKLRDLRYQSMVLVREFVKDTPITSGLVISGRAHYFDRKEDEIYRALGLPAGAISISLTDFTEDQVSAYLKKRGWSGAIPSWLPSRPLLVGYLAAKGVLQQTINETSTFSPAEGWDLLLDRVCEREAGIDIGISGDTVREIVEKLATKARCYVDGLGPLNPMEIAGIFRDTCGYEPDQKSLILLQRLPGLGSSESEDGSRYFVDKDIVDVARTGDVIRYIVAPYAQDHSSFSGWQCPMGVLGHEVVSLKLKTSCTAKQLSAAARSASDSLGNDCLAGDITQVLIEMGMPYVDSNLEIKDIIFPNIYFDENMMDYSGVTFLDCSFQEMELDVEISSDKMPKFKSCLFGSVIGRISHKDLPKEVFDDDCEFYNFSNDVSTNQAILDVEALPLPVRVGLSILKKLYVQSGSGRKHSALVRGLDHRAKRYVDPALTLLRQEGFLVESSASSEKVWLPVRKHSSRVRKILSSPIGSDDPIIKNLSTC